MLSGSQGATDALSRRVDKTQVKCVGTKKREREWDTMGGDGSTAEVPFTQKLGRILSSFVFYAVEQLTDQAREFSDRSG